MSLIGWPFPALVGTVAVLAIIGLVVGWKRLSRNRPHLIAGRIFGILGINVLVVFLAAVLLNQQFLFYASWTDLANSFGGTPKQTMISRGGNAAKAATVALRPGQGRSITVTAPRKLPALPSSAGSGSGARITYTVHGRLSGITSTVVVQLPPGYNQSSATEYPVLETFQGYPGQPTQWLNVLHLGDAVDSDAAAHQLVAPIIVSPQTEVPIGVDSECVNGGGGNPKVETWVTSDVPNWVIQHFHVRTNRQSWATIGLSAGGWCAAMAAMRHPGTYSAAIVMAGYYKPWFGPYYRPFEPNSPLGRSYDLLTMARKSPPPVAIWLESSHADRDSWPTTGQFLRDVRSPTAVTAKVLQNAGHRMSVWIDMLPEALHWLGTNVPGFRPAK
ncbi:S-formylglutathione hydrolase FrmB [Friedmanniella endophytica]|uniref:S-formylglutathione hydrolase FrmB n=1 Tax=Microlunatus kandeliicorticis TaxID=1759536 RepID=A0A7W3P781_9ACTN|nr:alpha/beta hydrolase-fold protein [Microlunatus kandeliicorticis]MBA8795856.1 S-formylglutathione hydrolase FrmB [Microlunatus kandeliicorticis]